MSKNTKNKFRKGTHFNSCLHSLTIASCLILSNKNNIHLPCRLFRPTKCSIYIFHISSTISSKNTYIKRNSNVLDPKKHLQAPSLRNATLSSQMVYQITHQSFESKTTRSWRYNTTHIPWCTFTIQVYAITPISMTQNLPILTPSPNTSRSVLIPHSTHPF